MSRLPTTGCVPWSERRGDRSASTAAHHADHRGHQSQADDEGEQARHRTRVLSILADVPTFLAIAPILPTADVQRMQAHYALLGFAVAVHQSGYATATRDDIKLHFHLTADHNPETHGGAVYISVDDADALHAEWSAAGVTALDDLWDPGFGVWESAHTDPDGNKISFGSPVRVDARP